MKRIIVLIPFLFIFYYIFGQNTNSVLVESPNKKVEAVINLAGEKISLTVYENNKLILQNSLPGIVVDDKNIGENVRLIGKITERTIDEKFVLFGNHSYAVNNCK